VAGNSLVANLGGAAVYEVVALDELAFNGVVGTLHAVAEAVLGDGLLVLVLLVRLLSLAGNGTRELLYLVEGCLLARVLARELVHLVRDLLGSGDLVEEAVLLVRFFLVARDEPLVEPLQVRDLLVAGDDSLVLGFAVRNFFDGRNRAAPTLFVIDDSVLAGNGGRVDVPDAVVMYDVRLERFDDTLIRIVAGCGVRRCCSHECECCNGANRHDSANTDRHVLH